MRSEPIHQALFQRLCICVIACVSLFTQTASAQFDFYPEIPTGSQRLGLESFSDVNAARDLAEIPDGSGRFMTNRSFQHMFMIQPSGSNSLFLKAGQIDVAGTQGLPALAFHPDFADVDNPGYAKFYTLTSDTMPTEPPDFASPGLDPGFQVLLTEWSMDEIRSNVFSGSSRVLMRVELRRDTHHYMNDIAFGPEKSLYISLGENTIKELASTTENVFGKILRIDPFGNNSANGQYGIPIDNPFVAEPGAVGEVFAFGLRNPYRIWFDSVTGDLYAGDVGWDSIEEVDRIVSSGNYGWPTKEGSLLVTKNDPIADVPDPITGLTKADELGLIDPLFEYDHAEGESVIGGAVYRGSEIPWLDGKVIFGDWHNWQIMAGDPKTGEVFKLPFDSGEVQSALGGGRIVSIDTDLSGEIYLAGGTSIVRLTALAGDLNRDGTVGANDIDLLYLNLTSTESRYDLDDDGDADQGDVVELVSNILGTRFGDANLDMILNEEDFDVWNSHVFQDDVGWASGDFNGDRRVDGSDLNILLDNNVSVGIRDCDLNNDFKCDVKDINLISDAGNLVVGVPVSPATEELDFNADGLVDTTDLDLWLIDAADANGFTTSYLPGDADLDGVVGGRDLNALGQNWRKQSAVWQSGDFNGDGIVDVSDLDSIGRNWRTSIPLAAATQSVPEPTTVILLVFGITGILGMVRRYPGLTQRPSDQPCRLPL